MEEFCESQWSGPPWTLTEQRDAIWVVDHSQHCSNTDVLQPSVGVGADDQRGWNGSYFLQELNSPQRGVCFYKTWIW
ncbi:hypothetical protein AOLI_G00293210 [Acnodon oligacanthus]